MSERDEGRVAPSAPIAAERGARVDAPTPAHSPGRETNVAPDSSSIGVPPLDDTLDEVERQMTRLDDANRQRDPHTSFAAASTVRRGLGDARASLMLSGKTRDTRARARLDALERAAEPLLIASFQPSKAAVEASRTDASGMFVSLIGSATATERPPSHWDREAAAWRDGGGTSEATALAQRATAGAARPLPFLGLVQTSFGRHDVSHARAEVGGDAAQAAHHLGARAFTVGDRVGFAEPPDLHTAAHEAAHVVQQRAGVALRSDLDQPGDAYEQHADAVADAVVRGESAEPLLDEMAGRGATAAPATPVVQRKTGDTNPRRPRDAFALYLHIHETGLRAAIAEVLGNTMWPDPADDVPFAPGARPRFAAGLAARFANLLGEGERFPTLLHPSDVVAQFRILVPDRTARWSPAFGQTFARIVERAALASLTQRVGPRYRAALARGPDIPRGDDVVAGHPIDRIVADELARPGVVDVSQVTATGDRGAPASGRVHVRWLGREHAELWNFVHVSPSSATAEDVALALWGDPKKSSMAFAIRKYSDRFRIAPAHARKLLRERYPAEVIGARGDDESEAAQLVALARLSPGDAALRQLAQSTASSAKPKRPTPPPDVTQLMKIERGIGEALDAIKQEIAIVGMASMLAPAYDARADRVSLLADADAATRATWLPVLQFQHAQLMTIRPRIPAIARRLAPLRAMPAMVLNAAQTHERDQLHSLLASYVGAAGVSHLRDESSALLKRAVDKERAAQQDRLDAAEIDLVAGASEAAASPAGTPRGTAQAMDRVAQQRQAALQGTPRGRSSYEQHKAVTEAGEFALASRMRAAGHAIERLRLVAREVYGEPTAMQKALPVLRRLPEVLLEVGDRLRDVERTQERATREGTPVVVDDPHAPDDWADWLGRAAGLQAARTAFAKIAGDQSIGDFLRDAREQIQDEQMWNAITSVATALLITIATGMGAAALGRMAAAALVTEASGLVMRGVALAVDVSINATLNTAVQLLQSAGTAPLGRTTLENALTELLSRGLLGRLRSLDVAAHAEARQLAQLPHLAPAERQAVLATTRFASANVMAELVGGMATTWAANRIVHMFHTTGQTASEPFAQTVLQQGAAIGLGKFFHGRLTAWTEHRKALEATKIGALPEAKALFAARDQFYRDAEQLAQNPSPELSAGEVLAARDRALIKQERALLARPGADEVARNHDAGARSAATDSHEGARAPTTRDPHAIGARDARASRSRETPRAHDPHASHAEAPHTHDDAPKPSPVPVYETRAEMIPGSTFSGRAGAERGPAVLADARTALVDLVRSSRDASISVVDASNPLVGDGRARAEQTFILLVPGRAEPGRSGTPPPERFTIRIATGPLAGNTVARTIVNPTQQGLTPTAAARDGRAIRGRYVIQLSNRLDAAHVKRAVAHELAEIRAIRELVDAGRHAGPDALGRGARGQELSPNDRGRLAEVEVLAQQLAAPETKPAAREAARTELIALADHLGLLDGDPASRARFERAASGLGKRGREALNEIRRSTGEGQPAHDELSATRTRAAKDRSEESARAHANRPAHDMPSGLDEHGRPLAGPELEKRAREAAAARQARSDTTWTSLEALQARAKPGEIPELPFELQIGGGASLAARDRGHLLVDDRGRWQADGNHDIAQTATQTKATADARLGDPTEIVGPSTRVPRAAISYWEDHIAAQGPVVNGRANLRIGDGGQLLVDIVSAGKTLTFRTNKVPSVATGFVPEMIPGAPRGLTPTVAATALDTALKDIADKAVGDALRAAAQRARVRLKATPMVTHDDAIQLLSILGDPALRSAVESVPEIQAAWKLGSGAKHWRDLKAADDPAHPHVFFGDQANLGREQALRSNNWVVAGTGGTAVSAAEIVLSENAKAHVTMVGPSEPAGLLENDQFRKLAAMHADAEVAKSLRTPPGDGRLHIKKDYAGAPQATERGAWEASQSNQQRWIDESNIPAAHRSKQVYDVNGPETHIHGSAYIAAVGRADAYPPAVASLIDQARRRGGDYKVKALFHEDQYVGYRVTVVGANSQVVGVIDVTGAASRSLPLADARAHADKTQPKDLRDFDKVKPAEDWDAPAESGNFPGGFGPTASQAARYAAFRRQQGGTVEP